LKTIKYSSWPWGTQVAERPPVTWRTSTGNMDPQPPNYRSLHKNEPFRKVAFQYMFLKQS
jgi:hypothetical protein